MKIRLKNFRSFRDTGWVEIRPLTVLVGANSSGKSSFLRFFPLMKQTLMQPSGSPLLWFGNLVDFGSFSEALSRQAQPKEIELRFALELERGELARNVPAAYNRSFGFSGPIEIGCTLLESKEKGSTVLTKLELELHNFKIRLQPKNEHWSVMYAMESDTFIHSKLRYVSQERFTGGSPFLLPSLWPPRRALTDSEGPMDPNEDDEQSIVGALRALCMNLPEEQLRILSRQFVFDSVSGIREQWNRMGRSSQPTLPNLSDDDSVLLNLQQKLLFQSIPHLVSSLREKLERVALSVQYIGPFRMMPERFYRRQELNVGQIDAHGENLAMFLDSLSREELDLFSDFAQQYLGHKVVLDRSANHVQLQLLDSQGNKNNLVDMGYGFSQVLPIVAQSWHAMRRYGVRTSIPQRRGALPGPMVCIEQPELHLHPELQSYLADMFIASHRPSQEAHAAQQTDNPHRLSIPPPISFMIETHSEALLARLGAMVEAGKVSSEDINVLLFEKDNKTGITTVRSSTFNAQGELEDWPMGFFAPSLRD